MLLYVNSKSYLLQPASNIVFIIGHTGYLCPVLVRGPEAEREVNTNIFARKIITIFFYLVIHFISFIFQWGLKFLCVQGPWHVLRRALPASIQIQNDSSSQFRLLKIIKYTTSKISFRISCFLSRNFWDSSNFGNNLGLHADKRR